MYSGSGYIGLIPLLCFANLQSRLMEASNDYCLFAMQICFAMVLIINALMLKFSNLLMHNIKQHYTTTISNHGWWRHHQLSNDYCLFVMQIYFYEILNFPGMMIENTIVHQWQLCGAVQFSFRLWGGGTIEWRASAYWGSVAMELYWALADVSSQVTMGIQGAWWEKGFYGRG